MIKRLIRVNILIRWTSSHAELHSLQPGARNLIESASRKGSRGQSLQVTVYDGMWSISVATRLGLQERSFISYLFHLWLYPSWPWPFIIQVIDQLCRDDLEIVHSKNRAPRKNKKPYGYFHELEMTTTEWAQVRKINKELEVSHSIWWYLLGLVILNLTV